MTFWDEYDAPPPAATPEPEPTHQNDTSGQCAFCGVAGDDVIIGVCRDCGHRTEASE